MLVLPNMIMKLLNVRKNKGTTKYDKSKNTCDISTVQSDIITAQCDDGTIKCSVLVTWYSKLPIYVYYAEKRKRYFRSTHADLFSPFFPFIGLRINYKFGPYSLH